MGFVRFTARRLLVTLVFPILVALAAQGCALCTYCQSTTLGCCQQMNGCFQLGAATMQEICLLPNRVCCQGLSRDDCGPSCDDVVRVSIEGSMSSTTTAVSFDVVTPGAHAAMAY